MTLEHHPYGVFLPKKPTSMIIGSFPIGKFTNPDRRIEIKPHEFDFFFGGEKNLLWKLLGDCFGLTLKSKSDIQAMLESQGIAIGDVIKACRRKEGRASDADLYDIVWNHDLLEIIHQHGIKKIFFTSRQVQTWFERQFGATPELEKILLLSPSAQSARSIVRRDDYRQWRLTHKDEKVYAFILHYYRRYFFLSLKKP